jgi:hypothetical protein
MLKLYPAADILTLAAILKESRGFVNQSFSHYVNHCKSNDISTALPMRSHDV